MEKQLTPSAIFNRIKAHLDRQTLLWSFVFTYAFGLTAHAYGFLNFLVNHDSLTDFAYNDSYWTIKIKYGRFLKPVFDFFLGKLRGYPWLSGLIGLLWIALSVYFVVRILGFKKKGHIAVIAGIMSTNIVVSSLAATYMQDFSGDLLALLFAVFACYLWYVTTENIKTVKKKQLIPASFVIAFCLFLSLGIYQAYLFVFIALVLIVSILKLITNPEKVKEVWFNGIRAAADTLIGGGIYFIILKLITLITGIELASDYNSVSSMWTNTESIFSRIYNTLRSFIFYTFADNEYVCPRAVTIGINAALALLCIVSFFRTLKHTKSSGKTKAAFFSIVLFVVALPFVMCGTRLLNSSVHQLMVYACFFTYILYFSVTEAESEITHNSTLKKITCVLLCCFIFINIQTANAGYVKKSTEQQSTLSVMTRVLDKIEATDGYKPGETPVVFIGVPGDYTQEYEEFSNFESSVGLHLHNPISYYYCYSPYFKLILKTNVNVAGMAVAVKMKSTDEVKAMPVYPSNGSIKVIDGTVVVKFADSESETAASSNDTDSNNSN